MPPFFVKLIQRSTQTYCEATTDPSLSQALHLLNGSATSGKIVSGKVVDELLADDATPEQALQRLYVRCMSRYPTDDELKELLVSVGEAANQQQGLQQ